MPVYGYVRYSRLDHDRGLAAQKKNVMRFFEKVLKPQGLTFDGFFQDRAADARELLTSRKMGMTLHRKAARGDTVIVARGDRCFPSLRDLIDVAQVWRARGVRLIVIDIGLDTAADEGAATIAHFDSYERVAKKMSMTSNNEAAAERRVVFLKGFRLWGQPPLGWKYAKLDDGTHDLVPWEEERENFRRIKAIHDRVGTIYGTQRIAAKEGIRTLRGGQPYQRVQITKMLSKGHEILADKPPRPVFKQYLKGLSEEERIRVMEEMGYARPDRYRDRRLLKGTENGDNQVDRLAAEQQNGDRDPENDPIDETGNREAASPPAGPVPE